MYNIPPNTHTYWEGLCDVHSGVKLPASNTTSTRAKKLWTIHLTWPNSQFAHLQNKPNDRKYFIIGMEWDWVLYIRNLVKCLAQGKYKISINCNISKLRISQYSYQCIFRLFTRLHITLFSAFKHSVVISKVVHEVLPSFRVISLNVWALWFMSQSFLRFLLHIVQLLSSRVWPNYITDAEV